ncbi:MAG TPA: DUF1015 domain-containing protein [Candidatus Acidoferrales bacterium]|jgi:uncharacterized protein (DUF1015 family)|nr:DUF1015 domain-containing protein [Candidatus Acidoferrales bacterium]
MAEIFPFPAYRYNAALVDPAKVLTQPYDKITPAMAEKYAAASPYNLIPIEKGKSRPEDTPTDNVYTRAAKTLEEWIRARVIVQDQEPSFYAYFQEYTVPGTSERRVRKGFIAVGRIEDYSAGLVFRHEQTLSGPKADRLELLRHTQTHTGQLFMLYSDPAARVDALLDAAARRRAEVEIRDEYDVVHKLRAVTDAQMIEAIRHEMEDKKLVIADGHHRYETALAYRDECRARAGRVDPNAPYEKVMMTLFNTAGTGLTILPTHRVIANVPGFTMGGFRAALANAFDVQSYPFSGSEERPRVYEQFRRDLLRGQAQRAIGAYAGDGAFYIFVLKKEANLDELFEELSPAQRRLDVVLLHRLILERGLKITLDAVRTEKNITYEREMDTAIGEVDSGRAQICFLLNPVGVETVAEVAMGGEVLPQKSTDFFPKLLSGITMYRLKA